MKITTTTLLAVAACALAPTTTHAQSATNTGTVIPIQRTAAQRRHRGPATERARLIATPGEYKNFFDPQGAWSIDRQPFYTGGERVVAYAPGEAGATPTIVSIRQIGTRLLLRVAYADQAKNAEQRARPFHAVVIPASALNGPVRRFEILPFRLDPGTGGGAPTQPTKPPTIDRPLGGDTPAAASGPKRIRILRTVAQWRVGADGRGLGPAVPRAGIAARPAEYRALFYPQGQWAVRKPVFYTGGERVVLVAAGQERVELKIVRLIQRGSILTAVVRKRKIPAHLLGRAFHAVAIKASDLTGPVTKVVAVTDTDRRIPIRGDVKQASRYGGPARKRAGLAKTPGEYKALFHPQGQWSVDAQPYYTNGERAVVIAGGEGNFDLRITALHQRGNTLIATVEKRTLRPSLLARPFHAVKILASDLQGAIRRVRVRVTEVESDTPRGAGSAGLRGALTD